MEANTTTITEYQPIAAALAGIEKYRGIVLDVSTPQGMTEAKAIHREVSAPRIALEKARKKLKEDVLEKGRLIDGEARRIGNLFAAIEDPIKQVIDAEEERVERERQAAIEAEAKRIADEEAARKRAEEEKIAAERAQLARERAAFEAEKRKAEEEERARNAAAEAEERRRFAEQESAARAQREREEAEARAKAEAERKAREEQEAIERRARQEREAEERQRLAAALERQDSRQMLDTFCTRFGHLHPELAEHIRAYLAQPVKLAA